MQSRVCMSDLMNVTTATDVIAAVPAAAAGSVAADASPLTCSRDLITGALIGVALVGGTYAIVEFYRKYGYAGGAWIKAIWKTRNNTTAEAVPTSPSGVLPLVPDID